MATVKKKTLWSERGQIVTISLVAWALLAFWSLSAFWGHIDALPSGYKLMAKVGAAAGEIILLAFVLWHCFHKKLRVRLWALIFAFVLGASLLLHSGGLRSGESAKVEQSEVNGQVVDALTKMSREQAAAVGAKPTSNATQRERLNIAGKNAAAQAEVAKAAQDKAAAAIIEGNEKAKDSSLLPRWYIDQWMYTGMFFLSLLLLSILLLIMMLAPGRTDANYDGIPDDDELQPQFKGVPMPDGLTEHQRFLYAQGQWDRPPRQSPSLPQSGSHSRENARRGHFVASDTDGLDQSKSDVQTGLDRSRPHDTVKDLNLMRNSLTGAEREGRSLLLERLKVISFHNPGYSFKIVEGADNIKIRLFKSERQRQIQTAACFVDKARLLADVVMMSEGAFCARLVGLLNRKGFNLQEVTR